MLDYLYTEQEREDILNALRAAKPEIRFDSNIGGRTLSQRLEQYALALLKVAGKDKTPSSDLAARLAELREHAEAIHKALTAGLDGAILKHRLYKAVPKGFRVGTTTEAGEIVSRPYDPWDIARIPDRMKMLAQAAGWAERSERGKIVKDHNRHRGKTAQRVFIAALAKLWREATGKEPAAAYNPYTEEPAGPFVRFVFTCYAPAKDGFHGEFNAAAFASLTADDVRNFLRRSRKGKSTSKKS